MNINEYIKKYSKIDEGGGIELRYYGGDQFILKDILGLHNI